LTVGQARIEDVWAGFCSLSREEKRALAQRFLEDADFREDLLDVALILQRAGEPSRPYVEFAEELKREGRL